MSVGYTFSLREDCPTSLTLAMGLSIVQSLERLGLGGVSLKWPNDLIACDRKVGGILTEVVAGSKPRPTAIVGLGLNLDFSASEDTGTIEEIAGTASDLRCCNSQLPATNLILAGLIDGFLADLARFDEQGFASFRDRWPDYDWLRTRKTVVDTGQGQVSGIACGVGPDGALELCAGSERMQIVSGSITAVGAPA